MGLDRYFSWQWVRLLAAVAALGLGMMIGSSVDPDTSSAHLFNAHKKWYFSGYTWEDESWASADPVDPVTLIFQGNGPHYPMPYVQQWILTGYSRLNLNMVDRWCNLGHQRMRWRDLSGPGGGNHTSDKEDVSISSSSTCGDQVHSRLWDDQEHAGQFSGHGTSKFVVGSVHRENRVCTPPVPPTIFDPDGEAPDCDHVRDSTTFETEAQSFAAIVGEGSPYICWDPKWTVLPGSFHPFDSGNNYSDGYLSRMTWTTAGNC